MGLLRKLFRVPAKPIKLKKVTNLYLAIDKLKKQQLLETTDYGVFYTYLEVVKVNADPTNILKQLYIYGRTTGLIKQGQTLEIRDLDDPNDDFLIAEVNGERVQIDKRARRKAETKNPINI